jgi:hypothetical protein
MSVIYLQNRAENDENLPSSQKKQSTQKRKGGGGEGKEGTRWMDPSLQKEETTNEGGLQGEHE